MSKKREKKAALDPMDEIKKMESIKRKEAVKKVEEKINFDVWWSLRRSLIPRMHQKEVILANFKAWGLSKFEKMVDFDAALAKYGIKF
jgi:hypothetical protein